MAPIPGEIKMTSEGQDTTIDHLVSSVKAGRRSGKGSQLSSKALVLPQTLTVQHLAELIQQSPIDVIKQLMRNGVMAAMNQVIDYQIATLVTRALGIRTTMADIVKQDNGTSITTMVKESSKHLVSRPPIVTILGHVDHGKTTLLDVIRRTNVTDKEIGGITQHIGAYQVECNGQNITFLDTPGHAAFTAIRSRGAKITDIAVLVVAADDGIMPQTVEAIAHAKAAAVPIVVAINKMDVQGADLDRVKRQLSEHDLLVEEWGGDVIAVPISARQGEGIDALLENILLVAEVAELKANPNRAASGVIIEAKLDRKRGPTSTVLVLEGSLKVGDHIVAGTAWGRIRAISDGQGKVRTLVTPGAPGEVLGFSSLPEAGDVFTVVPNEKTARTAAENKELGSIHQIQNRAMTLEDIVKQIDSGGAKDLNLVIKADVQGSVEAMQYSLENLTEGIAKVHILHAGSGATTESDVLLASASNAIIVEFTVKTENSAERLAQRLGVEIRHYDVIYQVIEDVEKALHGLIDPVFTDVVIGRAEVRELFASKRNVNIAGCRVIEGRITKGAPVRVMRDGVIVKETTVSSLRHFRDEVNEITAGTECGVILQGFNEFETADILESHRQERGRS
jgi:translation initiation factor IF-2